MQVDRKLKKHLIENKNEVDKSKTKLCRIKKKIIEIIEDEEKLSRQLLLRTFCNPIKPCLTDTFV